MRRFTATVVVLLLATAGSGCSNNRAITPSERVKPIETSQAASTKEAQRVQQAAGDGNAISVAQQLASNDYHIGPDDVLEINVFQVEDLSGEYTVNGRGELNMPLIGQIAVAGMTAADIENALQLMYGQVLSTKPRHYGSRYRVPKPTDHGNGRGERTRCLPTQRPDHLNGGAGHGPGLKPHCRYESGHCVSARG